VNYTVSVTNRCSSNLFFSCTPPSGIVFPPGITTVHCVAGFNTASNQCNFTVSVVGACPNGLGLVVARDGNVVQVAIDTTPGAIYALEYTDSIDAPDWKSFQVIIGDGTTVTVTDSADAAAKRFYRVRMEP